MRHSPAFDIMVAMPHSAHRLDARGFHLRQRRQIAIDARRARALAATALPWPRCAPRRCMMALSGNARRCYKSSDQGPHPRCSRKRYRIRVLLADDPGAGKTSMAALLIKEPNATAGVPRAPPGLLYIQTIPGV